MIASLAMYDLPDCRAANDRLWAGIRDAIRKAGGQAPDALTRGPEAYWPAWEVPELILSQTCGLPYRSRLHGRVTLVGTPDYGLEGCPPGYYRSLFIARADDPRGDLAAFDGARLAFNEDLSQSGWGASQNHAAMVGIRLPAAVRTGAHVLSAGSVADGAADLTAVDAVTWRLLCRNDPALTARLKIIEATDPTPGLPFIAAPGADAARLFGAAEAGIAGLSPADRETLGLRGIVAIPAAAYLAVPNPPAPVLAA